MHHQKLPPRLPSTQEAGSPSPSSGKSAEGLGPCGCQVWGLNSNPHPGRVPPSKSDTQGGALPDHAAVLLPVPPQNKSMWSGAGAVNSWQAGVSP